MKFESVSSTLFLIQSKQLMSEPELKKLRKGVRPPIVIKLEGDPPEKVQFSSFIHFILTKPKEQEGSVDDVDIATQQLPVPAATPTPAATPKVILYLRLFVNN